MDKNVTRGERGRVQKGSKIAQKYDMDEVTKTFEMLVERCKDGEFLSIQECTMHSNMNPRTFRYYCKQYPKLNELKEAMNDYIIANVNRMALSGKFNPASAIFRMKQLGEKDNNNIEVEIKEQPIFKLSK